MVPNTHSTHLWHEHQAQGDRRAEEDEQRNEDKRGIGVLVQDGGDGDSEDAHDGHVVDGHPDVLGVVESRNLHISCLPSKKCSKQLQY